MMAMICASVETAACLITSLTGMDGANLYLLGPRRTRIITRIKRRTSWQLLCEIKP